MATTFTKYRAKLPDGSFTEDRSLAGLQSTVKPGTPIVEVEVTETKRTVPNVPDPVPPTREETTVVEVEKGPA